MEEIKSEESWNKKRIFAALFLIALLVAGVYFFRSRVFNADLFSKSVKGVNSEEKKEKEDFKIDVQEAVIEKINSLKQEVSSLNIIEVASSSPQIQKIINDIKALEQYPTNQAKEICKQICGL